MFSTRSDTLKISRYAPALSEMILRKSGKTKRCDNQPNGYAKRLKKYLRLYNSSITVIISFVYCRLSISFVEATKFVRCDILLLLQ